MQDTPKKLSKKEIDRINELGRIARTLPLTGEEQAEQADLRARYLAWFRGAIRTDGKPKPD